MISRITHSLCLAACLVLFAQGCSDNTGGGAGNNGTPSNNASPNNDANNAADAGTHDAGDDTDGDVGGDTPDDASPTDDAHNGDAAVDRCEGVVCGDPPPCHRAEGCVDGECVTTPLSEGSCDDGDPCTEGDACRSGACVGAPVVCDAPSSASCVDEDTLEVTVTPGACEDGACVYATNTTACAQGCEGDSCVGDPCQGVVCDSPPSPCHAEEGVCQSGVCTYAVRAGEACDDQDPCTEGDVCGAGGACQGSPVTCQSPPETTCTSATALTTYPATGQCQEGACVYAPVEVDCGGPCVDGACSSDPCAGVVCDAPPSGCHQAVGTCANGVCSYAFNDGIDCDDQDPCTEGDVCQSGVCAGDALACDMPEPSVCDGDTLQVFTSPGQCSEGACVYGSAEVACAFGCTEGACDGDPCADVSCDSPEPPRCVGDVLETPDAEGTCAGGTCSYATTLTSCLHGCDAGACRAPEGLVISELVVNSEGFPDTESFVEIHGPAGLAVDGLVLVGVNGDGGNDYASVALSGNLGDDGLFVVAHPDATGAVADAADMTDRDVDFQNGPDSVQLRFGDVVLDAVAYGSFGGDAVSAGEGSPVAAHAVGQSLHRDEVYTDTDDNATDFRSGAPTPGAPYVDTSCDTVLNPGCDCINTHTQPCGEDEGACAFGTQTCVDGAWGACEGGVGPTDEICGNGVDEDCDGTPDNGCGPEDVFTLGTCDGVAMSADDAMAMLGGQSRVVLASATLQKRNRSCDTCAWGDPSDWTIRYLTYSGGVSTRWMNLLMTMNLVLFNDGGSPKFSIQHTTFAGSTYDDGDGMVYGFPPEVIRYPHLRAYNHAPQRPSDYRELDYQAVDGTIVLGEGCLQWVADAFGQGGPPYTEGYGVIFRWN